MFEDKQLLPEASLDSSRKLGESVSASGKDTGKTDKKTVMVTSCGRKQTFLEKGTG